MHHWGLFPPQSVPGPGYGHALLFAALGSPHGRPALVPFGEPAPPPAAGGEAAPPLVEAKPFRPVPLPGISERTQAEHIELYRGYVEKTNEIRRRLTEPDIRARAESNFSRYRSLKIAEPFNWNGVKLHEIYFTVLGMLADAPPRPERAPTANRPTGPLLGLIERDFGSFEAWLRDFRAAGMAARGWALLVYDLDDGRLYNIATDFHDLHVFTSSYVLLPMDVFEHAYFIDYGTDRNLYIDAFLAAADWRVVEQRLGMLGLIA